MTELFLVRHGETEWNAGEIFRGRVDIDLSPVGRQQAELLAHYLKDIKLGTIFTSPLKRALQTAQIIAAGRNSTPVETEPGLIDIDFGDWQGMPRTEVEKKYAGLYIQWLREPHRIRLSGGESLDDVRQRALKVVDNTVSKHNGTVVIVSHRVVIKVIILALLGLANSCFWNIEVATCGLTIFRYASGRYILTRHNDVSFLKPLMLKRPVDF